jgi:membrane-associated phospholipid phosphatase
VKPFRATVVLTALLLLAVRFQAQPLPLADADPAAGADSADVVDPVSPAPDEPLLSPKLLLRHVATDQKRIWLFPVAAAQGGNWKPALAVIGATAGLVALDPHDTPFFSGASYQGNPAIHSIGHVLSGTNTGLFIAAVPISFYVAGLIHKDTYSRNTAFLAGEAVLNAEIVTIAMKDIGRRLRPVDVGPNGNFNDTWSDSKSRSAGGFGSFPSGHTAAAFSVATVFAERYRTHRWVPWIAYGLAGVVGLSRLNVQAHFPSDIFFGAALGYSVSHFVVLRP